MRFSEFNNIYLASTLEQITKKVDRKASEQCNIPVMMISCGNGFILQSEKYSKDNAGQSLQKYTLLKKGELAYNHGASKTKPFGVCYVLKERDEALVPFVYHCFAITNGIPKYWNYSLNTEQMDHQLKRIVSSGARMDGLLNISYQTYMLVKVYVPTNNEQQKIADFLSLIDNRIDTQNKIIEDLELLEKEINNTIINKLVKYKDLVKFSSLYNFAKEGGTPNTSHPEYYTKGSIPFVKIDDLTTKYLVSNQSFITKLGLENSSAWLIPANSILYSNGATIGAISINKYPVTTKQGILGIVPKSDYLSEYLYYFLRSNYFKKEICKITTQGTMKSAYIKDIDNILVPRINKKQQNEILTLLSEITLKIQKEKDMLELYKKQKTYLLKNMFI